MNQEEQKILKELELYRYWVENFNFIEAKSLVLETIKNKISEDDKNRLLTKYRDHISKLENNLNSLRNSQKPRCDLY